jgi:hypothetical protein
MTWNWEEDFAEENNRIRESMGTSTFERIRTDMQNLEEGLCRRLEDEESREEVRRRAARWILYAAVNMKMPIEECEALLESACRLGFDSPQRRVTTIAVFSRYCLLQGQKERGYVRLLPAMNDLEKSEHLAAAPADLLEGYRRLLAQLAP